MSADVQLCQCMASHVASVRGPHHDLVQKMLQPEQHAHDARPSRMHPLQLRAALSVATVTAASRVVVV